MRFKLIARCALVAALLLMAAACGRDGADPNASPTPRAGATSDAGDPSAGLGDDECRAYENAFAGFTPDAPAAGSSNFTQIADSLDHAAEAVPNEISDDLRVVATAYRNFAEGTAGFNLNDPSTMADASPEELSRIQAALQGMDSAEVRAAVANIEAFVNEHCPQG